jgi:hypothetical protein
MLKSKYANPLQNFVCHGVQNPSGDNHSYVLLVDESGQAVIQQISSDQKTIMFCEMTAPVSVQQNVIAAAITAFWTADVTSYTYVYMFQLQ